MDVHLLQKLATALGLGLLVGLQREKIHDPLAGIRTFALITVFGAVCGLLAGQVGVWLLGVGLAAVGGLFIAGYARRRGEIGQGRRPLAVAGERVATPEPDEARDVGLTTEVAALVMFVVGAYVTLGDVATATVIGGAVFMLLHLKEPMHTFVGRLGATDLRAIVQFVLIALVIFPILPDQGYGPWQVLNPHNIWLMVVLIVGISLTSYLLYQLVRGRAGTAVQGILGGMISSTATTISFARRALAAPEQARAMASVLVVATAAAQSRILVEAAVVAPDFWLTLSLPLLLLLAVMGVTSIYLLYTSGKGLEEAPTPANPAELKSALIFGGLYAGVTLAIAAAREWLGPSGLYAVALLSGLHDLDAITLGTARLVTERTMTAELGSKLILTACLANLAAKTAYGAALGPRRLSRRLMAWNGLFVLVGLGLLLFLP